MNVLYYISNQSFANELKITLNLENINLTVTVQFAPNRCRFYRTTIFMQWKFIIGIIIIFIIPELFT